MSCRLMSCRRTFSGTHKTRKPHFTYSKHPVFWKNFEVFSYGKKSHSAKKLKTRLFKFAKRFFQAKKNVLVSEVVPCELIIESTD